MKLDAHTISIINYRRDRAFETIGEVTKLLEENMLALAMNSSLT